MPQISRGTETILRSKAELDRAAADAELERKKKRAAKTAAGRNL